MSSIRGQRQVGKNRPEASAHGGSRSERISCSGHRRRGARWCVAPLVVGLTACHVDADDFKHSMVLEKPWSPEVTAPAGDSPTETRLYQLLYAGETGDPAHRLGQRVRMMAWLRTVRLSEKNLISLARLGLRVEQEAADDRRARERDAARELKVLAPIYARLETALADPSASTETLEALAAELATAQEQLYADKAMLTAHRDRIRSLIIGTSAWMSDLTHDQRVAIGSCRFVLTEHAAPLTNPGSYASLVGMIWDRGDFSALQTGEEVSADGPLDIGGLWALEHLRAPPSGYMVESARAGMLLLALMDPAFLPSIRAVMDGRGIPWPEAPEATSGEDAPL